VLFAYLGRPLLMKLGVSSITLVTAGVMPGMDVILFALTLLPCFSWRDRNTALSWIIIGLLLVPPSDMAIQFAQMDMLSMATMHNCPSHGFRWSVTLGITG
jgi:hypothetical protein